METRAKSVEQIKASLNRYSRDEHLRMYHQMLLVRRFEEKAAEMYVKAKIGGYLHLNIGEEGSVVGAISALEPGDNIWAAYREHGYAIVRGADPRKVMAELFGKATGICKGHGGSMHIFDVEHHFYGGWGIVGQPLPLAVGGGIYSTYTGSNEITLCVVGEGATDIGSFAESLNLASLWNLPIVFFCVNNQYAMGMPVTEASSQPEIWRKSAAYNMYGERVDGMDVLAVREAMERAVRRARVEKRPTLLEAMAYRYMGHSMADAGTVYRTKQEIDYWKERDPINNYVEALKEAKLIGDKEIQVTEEDVERVVEESVEFAENSPFPSPDTLYEDIYAP